jgi:hypothetical protein
MITVTQVQQDMAAIEKARRKRDREGREALTPAHAAAEAEAESTRRESAAKGYGGPRASSPGSGKPGPQNARGAYPGPGDFARPGDILPQDFTRPYLDQGHGAPSPQSGPPCGFPVPEGQPSPADYSRGYIEAGHAALSPANAASPAQNHPPAVPRVTGSGPVAAQLAAWQSRLSMTSPRPRDGQ